MRCSDPRFSSAEQTSLMCRNVKRIEADGDNLTHTFRRAGANASGLPGRPRFSSFSPEYIENPYAELVKRRKNSPAFYSGKPDYLVVNSMKGVAAVFTNPNVYSSKNVQNPVLPVREFVPIMPDSEWHAA